MFRLLQGGVARSMMLICLLMTNRAADAQGQLSATALDEEIHRRIQEVLRVTAEKGIPAELVIRKVHEGLSKNVSSARIGAVVQDFAHRLDLANSALAPVVSPEELVAGVDALQVGVSPRQLRDFRRLAEARSLAVPLGVLTQLVASRVPIPAAVASLTELLSRGVDDARLVALEGAMRADVAAGANLASALEARMKNFGIVFGRPDFVQPVAQPLQTRRR